MNQKSKEEEENSSNGENKGGSMTKNRFLNKKKHQEMMNSTSAAYRVYLALEIPGSSSLSSRFIMAHQRGWFSQLVFLVPSSAITASI